MSDDPLTQWCVRVVVLVAFTSYLLEVGCKLLWLDVKYAVLFAWLKIRLVISRWYRRHIGRPLDVWLMLVGLKHVPTWAEIEQYRLDLSAELGQEIPRPPELEEGLRNERTSRRSGSLTTDHS